MSNTQKYTIRPVFVVTGESEADATQHLAGLLMSVTHSLPDGLADSGRVVGFDVPLPEGGTAGTWRAP